MVKQNLPVQLIYKLLAGAVILAVAIAAFLAGYTIPPPHPVPDSNLLIGLRTRIGLEFQQPMRKAEVEERLRIDEGDWILTWVENTLWLDSQSGMEPWSGISIRLEAGAHSEDGRLIWQSYEIRFTIRQPSVVFLSTADQSLWISSIDASKRYRVSQEGAKVIDHAPSFDGEWIAYSSANSLNGADLWLVNRNGKATQRLVDCQADLCTAPVWSPDGRQLAYLRQGVRDPFSRPWLIGVDGRLDVPLFDDPGAGASDLSWSPDGRYISTYDLHGKFIRILDRTNSQQILIRNQAQTAGSWSQDGREFYYFDFAPADNPLHGVAFRLDMGTLRTSTLFMRGPQGMDYSLPVVSPLDKALLVGRRLSLGSHSLQLWLLNADASQETVVSGDFLTTRGAYSWDPAGEKVVFQQLALGTSRAEPEVLLWDRWSGTTMLLARQAARPQWLP